MKIALISDLHGNELALEVTLASIRRTGADRIVCLGDVATLGVRPREVVARLRDLGCICIMGNHDEFLLEPHMVHEYSEAPIVAAAVDWCRDRLTAEELAFVRGFERRRELDLGAGKLLLFHGSPRSHMENLLATTPPDELEELLGGERAAVMAGGHTHLQLLRQHRGALLVNPGSVGMPFREFVDGRAPTLLPHAEFATVTAEPGGVSVTLHRVDLDKRALRGSVEGSDNPLAPSLAQEWS